MSPRVQRALRNAFIPIWVIGGAIILVGVLDGPDVLISVFAGIGVVVAVVGALVLWIVLRRGDAE